MGKSTWLWRLVVVIGGIFAVPYTRKGSIKAQLVIMAPPLQPQQQQQQHQQLSSPKPSLLQHGLHQQVSVAFFITLTVAAAASAPSNCAHVTAVTAAVCSLPYNVSMGELLASASPSKAKGKSSRGGSPRGRSPPAGSGGDSPTGSARGGSPCGRSPKAGARGDSPGDKSPQAGAKAVLGGGVRG